MVNSRVGSLVVEPFLKKKSWVIFVPYQEFLQAEKIDSKLTVLSQENNVFRSYISVMFISIIVYVYKNYSTNWKIFFTDKSLVLMFSLLVLFLFAYKKQTSFVRKRVEHYIKQNKECKGTENAPADK